MSDLGVGAFGSSVNVGGSGSVLSVIGFTGSGNNSNVGRFLGFSFGSSGVGSRGEGGISFNFGCGGTTFNSGTGGTVSGIGFLGGTAVLSNDDLPKIA